MQGVPDKFLRQLLSTHEQNPSSPLVGQAVPVFSLRVCVCVCCLWFSLLCSFLQAVLTTCPLLKVRNRERVRESAYRERERVSVSAWVPWGCERVSLFCSPPWFPSLPCGAAVLRGAGGFDGAVRSPPGGKYYQQCTPGGWVRRCTLLERKESTSGMSRRRRRERKRVCRRDVCCFQTLFPASQDLRLDPTWLSFLSVVFRVLLLFCCCAETRTCCGVSSLGLRLSTHEQNSNSPLVGQTVPVSPSVFVCVCCSLFLFLFFQLYLPRARC